MIRLVRVLLIVCLSYWFLGSSSLAQQKNWADISPNGLPTEATPKAMPAQFRALQLDRSQLRLDLAQAPLEFNAAGESLEIQLPMPDGSFQRFAITESPIMEPALAAKFPQLKNYSGKGIDQPTARLRLALTHKGFHATILSPTGTVVIEPFQIQATDTHLSYEVRELPELEASGLCGTHEEPDFSIQQRAVPQPIGDELLTYRIAVSAEDGYTNFHGGTVADAIAAINVSLNQINAVYEQDASIRFVLVGNNDQLVFLPGQTDPFFTDPAQAGNNLPANQTFIDNTIGAAAYDIGHVFIRISNQGGTFVAGIATPGVVCRNGLKARGASSLPSPTGFNFDIEVAAHEIGHQFSALHNFNTTAPACINQRSANAAFEPGSGSTIMCYPGTCAPDNLQGNADPYFNSFAIESIVNYSRSGPGANCPAVTTLSNAIPSASVRAGGFFIPKETPFELTGEATDADGDALTYCWEQMDLGPAGSLSTPSGNAPIFRSWLPADNPTRVFPRLSNLLNNTTPIGELLPTYSRDLSFQMTVRDGNGGLRAAEVEFEATDVAGPFLVTYPNTSLSFVGGGIEEISWDVANTTSAPINCSHVDIFFSEDGGLTYPYLLADSVPNDGSQVITWPSVATIGGRVKVKAANNIFFDLSNQNITLTLPAAPGFLLYPSQDTVVLCGITSVDVPLFTSSLLGFSGEFGISAVGTPPGVSLTFSQDTLFPGETININVTTNDTLTPGIYQLTILGFAATGQSDIETLQLLITDPILPSPTATLLPGSGAVGIGSSPSFNWAADPESDSYLFELATSPAFGPTTLVSVSGLTGTSYTPTSPLTNLTTYYWRVQGENICGKGPFTPVQGFQTGLCLPYQSADVPKTLPQFGSPAQVTSVLQTNFPGALGSVRVVGLNGTHSSVDQLVVKLSNPAANEIELFSNICTDNDEDYNLNFADGAESTFDCPPTNGGTYAPSESMAGWLGQAGLGNGTWTLTLQDFVNFDNGDLLGWGLELCGVGVAGPLLVNNGPLNLTQWQLDTITSPLLQVQDASSSDDQLVYTVVNLPVHGGLLLNGSNLNPGDTFTQSDINQERFAYLHNGDDVEVDSFRFDVTNIAGGWIGVYSFDITIAKGPTAIGNSLLGVEVKVFPNPAKDLLQIELSGELHGNISLALYNLQGQAVHQLSEQVRGQNWQQQLSVTGLAPGMYLLQLHSQQGSWQSKVMIQP